MITQKSKIDTPSCLGRFGWERVGTEGFAVPVILRYNNIRYCPTRIVEQEIIKKYEFLPPEIFSCITLKSYYLTDVEAKLLNDINIFHTDRKYGSDFFITKDVIISAADVKELNRYLNITAEIFKFGLSSQSISGYFGVLRLLVDDTNPNSSILIPFITKTYNEQNFKFVPAKLLERFAIVSQGTIQAKPNDWDIMYLKMLCIYCQNNAQLEVTRDGHIVPLTDLVYARSRTALVYEDYDKPKQ